MAPDAIGVGTLRQLAELPTGGHPVLSLYLDLDSGALSTPAARDAHLGSLYAEPGLSSARCDVDRVQALLRAQPGLTHEAHGLAVFSCNEAGVLEAVRLPQAVKPMAVLDTLPWLEPLAELTTHENWGMAVVSPHRARLFRGGMRELTEFAAFDAQGQVGAYVQRVAERLSRADQRRPFAQLAIVAPTQLLRLLDASLDERLKAARAAMLDADLEGAPAVQLARVLAPMIEGVERTHERALLAGLEASGRDARPAATRLDQVLSMLEQGQVEVLLIAQGASFTAGLCPRCGRLSANTARCDRDGADLASVDAIAHTVDRALDQAADVVVINHERAWLHERGSIAALSRTTHRQPAAGAITPSSHLAAVE
jgi:hypothetical protein